MYSFQKPASYARWLRFYKAMPFLSCLMILGSHACAQDSLTAYKAGFKNPPATAQPRTWWHWTNGNVSKQGITKDLEWMKRAGIAGFQLSDVASGGGQTTDKKLPFFSSEWLNAVHHTASEAERLGLEMAVFTSAGWSLTGGPWVKPEQAMKKLVWSELQISGGKQYKGQLPKPPDVIGAIRNQSGSPNKPGYYADCAVIAYRTPNDEVSLPANTPKITSSTGTINASSLLDDDLNSALSVKTNGKPGTAWVQFTYDKPFKAKAISIGGKRGIPFGRVMASIDGQHYTTLVELPGKSGYRGSTIRTYAFPEITAKYYRIELTGAPFTPAGVISQATTQPDTAYQLTELKLFNGARVNRWEDKAGFNFMFEYESVATPQSSAQSIIQQADIVDLTGKMAADGTLLWNAPKGNWTIMRFGYSLTGAKNRPAVPSGLGYEVDKLSKKLTEDYMQGYTAPLIKELGYLYGKRLQYMMMDSWEAGIQNWTDEMPAEFAKRRGYSLIPYLPALAGRVVGSAEISDRFLWDFRRTLVDMFAENHYGVVTNYLNKQGIKTYGEAGGVSLESIEDALLNKKFVNIPMGEFWVKDLHPSSMYYEDVRGAASAGHVYGKNIIAAESFTGGNYESPYTLKKVSDYWFTQGINRLIFHTSAHQPLDTKPGNTMVGTHINRNITWAEKAAPFTTYLSRNAYLLQKGHYVADVAYLLNEGAPSTMPFWGAGLQPLLPEGYQFDYINADVLVNGMQADNTGNLVLPHGMQYKVLVLPNTQQLTLPVLRKIKTLATNGATIVGPKPLSVPGLTGYPEADEELHNLAAEIWGDLDGVSRTIRTYGKGRIIWGMPLTAVMPYVNLKPDLVWSKPLGSSLSWIHRTDGERDIYFLVNGSDSTQLMDLQFRINGKQPEIWRPGDGSTEPVPYTTKSENTVLSVKFDAREALFIVFSQQTAIKPTIKTNDKYELVSLLKGPWKVTFPEKSGAPAQATFNHLTPLTSHADKGIKYFSGTSTYSHSFQLKNQFLSNGSQLWLDLGTVGDIAEVIVNGRSLDTLWKIPFRTNITPALKRGENLLEIKVTNEWTNRLIGDRITGKPILDSYTRPFGGEYELAPSGLIGPVKIFVTSQK